MAPRGAAAITLVTALITASCLPMAPSPKAKADGGPTRSPSSASSSLAVDSTMDPAWITRPALTCGDRDRLFPPEALQRPGLAELGPDPAAAVLRSVIAEAPPETPFPESGWHRVVDRPDGVTFIARGDAETPWWVITVGVLGGRLRATEFGQCHLSIAPPDGVTFAQWWLAPNGPPITPESTTVAILLRERACAGGQPPDGRVLEPTIVISPEAIAVALGVRERPGGNDCPGNPAFAMELQLPEPIGARKLLDAGEFPPRSVTSTDPG